MNKLANWLGLDRFSGRDVSESNHIAQSIQDIITTPIGSRVMRRDYGSAIFELIDQPQTPSVRLQIIAATVMALTRWEPRISITAVEIIDNGIGGKLQFNIVADRNDNGRRQSFEVNYG